MTLDVRKLVGQVLIAALMVAFAAISSTSTSLRAADDWFLCCDENEPGPQTCEDQNTRDECSGGAGYPAEDCSGDHACCWFYGVECVESPIN